MESTRTRAQSAQKKKNDIESIGKKFRYDAPPATKEPPAAPAAIEEDHPVRPAPGEICPGCGTCRWWRPHGGDRWSCGSCAPPPLPSLAAEWIDDKPVVIGRAGLNACRPWCHRCGSRLGVETTWSDGTVEVECFTCKGPLESW